MIKRLSLSILSVLICQSLLQTVVARETFSLNTQWRISEGDHSKAESPKFDDSAWKPVTLPHSFNEDDAFAKDIKKLRTGIAWYRKRFKLPDSATGKKIFLEFEGVRQAARVYLNGQKLGLHENGITAFGFDVTNLVSPPGQENVLAVRIDSSYRYREQASDTSFQWNHTSFNASYGGINKNVWLHITDRVYQTLPLYTNLGTTGVYVYASDIDVSSAEAEVTVETEVKNDTDKQVSVSHRVQMSDYEGMELASFEGDAVQIEAGDTVQLKSTKRVSGTKFWSWGYGKLYDVTSSLVVDSQTSDKVLVRTGFRKLEFENGLVKLNGRAIHLKGYAQRTTNEWPAIGSAVPAWLSDYSNGLMVKGNANLVRWMHTCPWKQDVESCDRVGLMQAMPAGDSEKDVRGRQWEQRLEVMRDSIIYNRNHPSIVFYEAGNKGISEEHMREMKAIRDRYDPHGGRAIGCREMLDSQVAEYGGEMLYVNKSSRIPMWMMEYSRDEGLRKYWDEHSPPFHRDAPYYNRNQDSHAIENVIRWFDYWQARPGTGSRVNAGGVNIIFSDTNTHFRGDENYRRSGEVDAMRIPKDGYFAHQVMWNGWVDVEQHGTHILGHWNYKPGTVKDVWVVSTADQVELTLNEKSLGFGEQSHRFLFRFPEVTWEAGNLRAVGYDTEGDRLTEAIKETAGEPASIRLTAITGPDSPQADGHDLALIEVEVVDAQGRRCPTALNAIDFKLEGPAEWRGGIAQGQNNYILSKTLPVECGVNRVLIRSATQPGTIKLTATSSGLKPCHLEIETPPLVAAANGLAILPVRDLPPFLERGPTPLRPAFQTRWRSIEIADVRAGSNEDRAYLSFDDNERSSWRSDGSLSNAWVEYKLADRASISRISVKTHNWRRQTYPVTVTIDGKLAYEGELQRTLGYVTVDFPSVAGQTVRIELTGAGLNRDAFEIVELNQRNGRTDTSDRHAADLSRGTLGIVEIELQEVVN